jgi:hypothetical protein
MVLLCGFSVNATLKLRYTFANITGTTVLDDSGNSFNATIKNEAYIKTLGQFSVLDLSSKNGYLDLGSNAGELISTLSNFTISTYIYVDEKTDLSPNGNFVFSFANSTDIATDQNGCIFFSARAQRYAISKTHWGGESAIDMGQQLGKGAWKHITYVQNGTVGTYYVNGVLAKTGTVTIYPKALGKTPYNFIGRSPYVGDVYLKNALISDFRIYDTALNATEVSALATDVSNLQNAFYLQEVTDGKDLLIINGGKEEVTEDVSLPSTIGNAVSVVWTSSNEQYISNTGKVTRPTIGGGVQTVTLTATLTKNGKTLQKEFILKVLPLLDDAASVQKDLQTLLSEWSASCIREKVALSKTGAEGSVITWKSNNPDYISDKGIVLKLSPKGEGDKPVSLTATFSKGTKSVSGDFNLCIREDEGYKGYLFVYFTGNSGSEEAIRFAVSRDGYYYRALNGNNPIIASDSISYMGGVRDPHILRGEDGNYYMVVTDMKSDLGWNSNHGIILLKSPDLISWTHSKIDIQAKYPAKFGNIQSAWAPQTIYDSEKGKYMIYWSMRSPGVHEIIYYAYANSDFTDLEGEPQVLYNHPDSKSTIDGDIIYKDGKYNLFFKTEGDGNGIKRAVSDKLTGGYVMIDKYLQQTTEAVEGACVFRLTNTDEYILMYDVYANGRYEFTQSSDLNAFTKIEDSKISMDFHPRHGTVIPITEEEGERLAQKWGQSLALNVLSSNSPAVKLRNWIKNDTTNVIFLPVKYGTNLSSFDPQLVAMPGMSISPSTPQNFTNGAVKYYVGLNGQQKTYNVTAQVTNNPALDGYYADPQVLYSNKTNKYYIYPTSDGFSGWGGYYFKTFSSDDLVNWTDEGTILDMSTKQVTWANGNAWAPAIVEKQINGDYKYYFYYSGNPVSGSAKQIGVAVADSPTGPFVDSGKAMISTSPTGGGQQIDPAAFNDPVSGKSYIFWGNGYLAGAELNDDMISLKEGTTTVMTPDETFREGVYVIYRNGTYYYFWSEDDTGSENYKVRYGTSSTPLGQITVPANNIVIQKNSAKQIYATGHNSIIQIPGKDEWYIVYHRFTRPRVSDPGTHREVCIDKLEFNEDGSIKETIPTIEGISPLATTGIVENKNSVNTLNFYPNPATDAITVTGLKGGDLSIFNLLGHSIFAKSNISDPENINVSSFLSGIYLLKAKGKSSTLYSNLLIKK